MTGIDKDADAMVPASSKLNRDIHAYIDDNESQSGSRHQILFYGSIFDESPAVWQSLFPDAHPAVIIQHKIPKILDALYQEHTQIMGMKVGYPEEESDYDNHHLQRLGWYDFRANMEAVYARPSDNRTWWERVRRVPLPEQGEFSHYCVTYGDNLLTEKGQQVLAEYAKTHRLLPHRELRNKMIQRFYPRTSHSQ